MDRRHFLATLGAPVAGPVAALAQQAESAGNDTRIAAVEFVRLEGRYETVQGANRQHQVQPLHIYDEHRPRPYAEPGTARTGASAVSAVYMKIRTTGGLEGIYGPIDSEVVGVVQRQLARFLIGKQALAVETVWDQMYRSNRHARAGHYMMAISAIDNALWDLRGRYYKAPVWKLLGGPSRPSVEAYGSALGFAVEPEHVRRRAADLLKLGFRNQKWFLAYGPGDGMEGMKKNVELVATLRETLGDAPEIMFDAFMGWQLDYAIAWARQVERYRPRWIEEAFPMTQLSSFVQLRKSTSIPVATGEHFYSRFEVNEFLKAGAISVVQADPEWCGGVSELVKICTVASAYDAWVVPHGHSVHAALHVVASQPPITCPLVEYLYNKMQSYYYFEKEAPAPVNGRFALPERPGFGIELDAAKIAKQSTV